MDEVGAPVKAPTPAGPAAPWDSCDRCRGRFLGGLYTITMAYRPAPPAIPVGAPSSSATFHLCRSCAADLVQWMARADRR